MKRRQLLQLLPWTVLGGVLAPLGRALAERTSPPPIQLPGGLHVLATADFGSGNRNQRAVGAQMGAINSRDPVDLVILGGDNIYAGPDWRDGDLAGIEQTFNRPYRELIAAKVPFHAVLGNHDIRTANGDPQLAFKAFGMEGRWYRVRQGPVEFFMLDTNVNVPWQHQLPWLKQALAASTAPWKVVVGHHPIYSAGLYGDDPALINRLTPLFARYGVQLYINGHEHNYERTKPIAGTTYLTVGGGGASLRPVVANSRTAKAVSTYSFAELKFSPLGALTIRGIDTEGQVFDTATLRSGPGPVL
ncbi:MAG: metallophosphoesterase [Cyanobacteria bacterium K_DeepCast_35m_m2_023]|nr:metallophosphoesterase [Cyanobacteria bacterium K_DeepCast_35m_m2_023]